MTKTTEKIIAKIDPSAEYSLLAISKEGFLGQGKSYYVCRNIINDDRWKEDDEQILKAEKKGQGIKTTYFVKGENLIKYLKANG